MVTEARVKVARLGHLGDGLTANGVVIAGALPGDTVSVSDEGGLVAVLEASVHRVVPPCRHAELCGGCRLQHASLSYLAEWKRTVIRTALESRGVEAEVLPTLLSPPESRRRVGLAATRTKKGIVLGFHQSRSAAVVDISVCPVARAEIVAAFPALRALGLMAAPRKRAITLNVTASETGLDVDLREAKALDLPLRERAAAWAEDHRIARLSWNGEVVAMRVPPLHRFDGIAVQPPPGGFLQATVEGELTMQRLVLEATRSASRVADLFAGCGTFALPLARTSEVLAVESEQELLDSLDRAWREAERLKRIVALRRDLFRRPLLAAEFKSIDAVVFDPPRAGAEAQTREIAASDVPLVVGVSCNPVSFARDAAILVSAGFRLGSVTPVDQFLWSPHVELVGVFRR